MDGINNVSSQSDGENSQNTTELKIVKRVLDDLCVKVSSLNNVDTFTILEGNGGIDCTTVQSPYCITSQGNENIKDKIVDASDKSHHCLVGINNGGHNNNDSETCVVKELGEAGLIFNDDKMIWKDSEPVYKNCTDLSQDNLVNRSERLPNISECCSTSLTNCDAVLGEDPLSSGAETFPRVVAKDRSCCQPNDDMKGNQDDMMAGINGHTFGGTGVECNKITDDGQKGVVLSEKMLLSDNVNASLVNNLVDKNDMVDDLMYVMNVAQNDLQYLKTLSRDASSVPLQNTITVEHNETNLSSSSESSSSDESDSESVNTLKNSTTNISLDEEDDKITKYLPKTKDELLLSELPPPAPVEIVADEDLEIKPLGEIESILKDSALVIIKSFPDVPALDSDSILFFEDRSAFGQVFEIFGQVSNPHYCVRFDDSEEDQMEKNLGIGQLVYYAPDTTELTNFVFMPKLQSTKGSDASWKHDQEPPEAIVAYSDDEAESKAKSTRKKANKLKKRNENKAVFQNQTDKKACPSSQSSNQQLENRTAPHQTSTNSWMGNHKYDGGQSSPAQNPALFPRSPRFGFQPNHWSPLTNQYPPPLPGQPRHTYNEHQYYQVAPHLQQPLQPPHNMPPPFLQQQIPPHHLAPSHFQQSLPPPQHHHPPLPPPPPPTTPHLSSMWHPGQLNPTNQIPSQVHHAEQFWLPRVDYHNNYNSPPLDQQQVDYRQRFPYPPR